MSTHRVYSGRGDQTLRTLPQRGAVPEVVSGGTFAIYDTRFGDTSSNNILVTPGEVATIDAFATTLSNKAGPGAENRRTISVQSTAGMEIGRRYLLTSNKGVGEVVRIQAIPSATDLLVSLEIRGLFPTGSTLRGIEVSFTFPGSAADDSDNLDGEAWVVVWTFPGLPPYRETIHLVRGEEMQLATLEDLVELDPYLANTEGDRIDPAVALRRAHRDVRSDLLMAGAHESDMALGPLGCDAVAYLAAYLCCHHHMDDEGSIKKAAFYLARYQKIIASIKIGDPKPQVVTLAPASETRTTQRAAAFVF